MEDRCIEESSDHNCIGGLSVGGISVSSGLTWQAYGDLGYQVNDWFSAQAGYRYLLEDFDDDGFVYDVALHGPLIEFLFRF